MSKIENQTLVPEFRFPQFLEGNNWKAEKLGTLGKVSMCKRILKSETSSVGEIPFYKIGTFGKVADAFISRDVFEKYKKKYSYPKKGDILISASGTIGRLVVFDGEESYFQDSNIVWIDNDEKLVINKFLYYCYQNVNWVGDGNVISRLYNDNLRNISIFIPSRLEQEAISGCLSSMDDLISSNAKKLNLLKLHKKGLMQNLFPEGGKSVPDLRLDGFFEDWEKTTFSKLFEIGSGKDHKHLEDGDIPVYGTGGYMRSVNDYLYEGKSACIGRKGTINRPMLLDGKFWTVDTLFYTHSFKSCIPEFVYLLFQNIDWLKLNEAGGVPSLSKVIIDKVEVFIPEEDEQQEIVNIIFSLDDLIERQEMKIETLKKYKEGLMQKLFPSLEGVES
ncbi:restriction endonuclease subunit S [Vibrio sp. 10N.286.48.F5]|uniref:restriction endonuclease subunit S n=1 Tax=Vibrio sp. 10N.286.48.F5 TaxID=3229699 RepID=UPI0035511DED